MMKTNKQILFCLVSAIFFAGSLARLHVPYPEEILEIKSFMKNLQPNSKKSSALSSNVMPTVFNPDEELGQLFVDVQMAPVFPDSKTFVDCTPLYTTPQILAAYDTEKAQPNFNLTAFVLRNFLVPQQAGGNVTIDPTLNVTEHINALWPILTHQPAPANNSLIVLPNEYVVPGGRFREVYYWDSFFTMLGLQQSGLVSLIQHIIDNFTYLLNTVGHIPNGNRGYFLSRSQPPFYALMVGILAEEKGDEVYANYGSALLKEYSYWMDGAESLTQANNSYRRVVKMPDGTILNRYWDDKPTPRPEAYKEDVKTASESGRDAEEVYRNIRAAAESGWDFSGRWFKDGINLHTIHTTELIPVDLNALMYNLELTLAEVYKLQGDKVHESLFRLKAQVRRYALLKYCWSEKDQYFYDYDFVAGGMTNIPTIAAVFPLYFEMVSAHHAEGVAKSVEAEFLQPGGVITSIRNTTQQWDLPNGWAPLQWMTIKGLKKYNYTDLSRTIQKNWMSLNVAVYNATGKLVEKYNVVDIDAAGGGGEYPLQDGFGWTNGVLSDLLSDEPRLHKFKGQKIAV